MFFHQSVVHVQLPSGGAPYDTLTNDALREKLRQKGLSTGGNKKDLIHRLKENNKVHFAKNVVHVVTSVVFCSKATVDGKPFPVSKNLGSEFEQASNQCDGNVLSVLIVGVGISK